MIGIFDSGVGGMTVARAVEKVNPSCPIIYYGDLARTPYGSKSPETIIKYSRQNTEFLLSKGAKLIIIACNSASSVASEVLRKEFAVPIFEVITPAVHKVLATSENGRIGVIGTRATIKSDIYNRQIKDGAPDFKVFSQSCPLLVPLVEEGWLDHRETKMIVRRYLHPLKLKKIDTLVLGCTHYPLLSNLIRHRVGKRVKVIDSSEAVALELQQYLEANPDLAAELSCDIASSFYASDVTDAAIATAKRIFGRNIDLIKVDPYC
ncbi:MAG: glutamate racemase [Proteobacteria bacterium]|nr:glutamate racemase [Pseudomonadota bacterium]MBU1717310.1 glutamate racemase [Pseudomonadota bacterium]